MTNAAVGSSAGSKLWVIHDVLAAQSTSVADKRRTRVPTSENSSTDACIHAVVCELPYTVFQTRSSADADNALDANEAVPNK